MTGRSAEERTAAQAISALFLNLEDFGRFCTADFHWRFNPTEDYPEGLAGDQADLVATFGGADAIWACDDYETQDVMTADHTVVARLSVHIHMQARPQVRRRADVAVFLRFAGGLIDELEIYACVAAVAPD